MPLPVELDLNLVHSQQCTPELDDLFIVRRGDQHVRRAPDRQLTKRAALTLLEVFRDGYVERNLLNGFPGRFEARYTEIAAFQFMALAALRLECLSGGNAGALSTTRSAYVPLDIVTAVGDRSPVVIAFGIVGGWKTSSRDRQS